MIVDVQLTEGLRTEAEDGTHTLVMDEPVEDGGSDSGFKPTSALLASLGACTAITLRLYARRKEWPLENARIRVSMERGTAAKSEPNRFSMAIVLEGALDEAQRERLLAIAGRCPVHRILEGENVFEERLVESLDPRVV